MRVVIVSGVSGSGKTTFLKALEDAGYYCVDNFPLTMLPKVLEVYELTGGKINRCAFVIDIREREFFGEGRESLAAVKERYKAEILFLETSDDLLLRRFKETRRAHPFHETPSIRDALSTEREQIGWIREMADRIIDTSQFTPHGLRTFVTRNYGEDDKRMIINLMSFGYSYGLPPEADIVLDVRFLPNPFFIDELKDKTGLDPEVVQYIKANEPFQSFFPLLVDFCSYLIPLFEAEGKSYLTIGIGCTGGKHRSPALVNELDKQFNLLDYKVSVVHRDIHKEDR